MKNIGLTLSLIIMSMIMILIFGYNIMSGFKLSSDPLIIFGSGAIGAGIMLCSIPAYLCENT